MPTTTPATDIGPATAPPAWCLPGTEPSWDTLTEEYGGGTVCTWTRHFGGDVWISCEDTVAFGRILRSVAGIGYTEPPGHGNGIDAATARRLAAALIEAADVLDRLQ